MALSWLDALVGISRVQAAKFNELQEEKASAHRQKVERDQKAARHKAFEENAKKHNIPIPKKKKVPWED